MSKAKRSTKRPPRSGGVWGLVLALSVSTMAGIGLAQWQPGWFTPFLPSGIPDRGKKFVLVTDRLFLPVTATLRPEMFPLLDNIAQNLPADRRRHIRIVSYARSGEESINLSYRRALAVEAYLKQKAGNDRYYWFASGVYSPVVPDDRIEVIIH